MATTKHYLGSLQLAIMRLLWARGRATVAQVQQGLTDRPLAYSTLATLLVRMERKGLVTHETQGRTFIYQPAVSEEHVSRSLAGELVDDLFAGSVSELVSHFLEGRDVDAGELSRIKALIARHEAARRRDRKGGTRG